MEKSVFQESNSPEAWVASHGDALYGYAWRWVRDRDIAEDLVQETFLAAWRGREQFAGLSSPRTWMIGILRRKIFDHLKRANRWDGLAKQPPDEDASVDFFDAGGHWKDSVKSWSVDPAATLEKGEFWSVFEGCRTKLSPVLAKAFVLREIDGVETDEICDLLGLSQTNLSTRLYRARLLLRSCLQRNWFDRQEKGGR
jgi:RNA polymerase sigma-70 factor (ECF subfamily)